MLRDAHKKPELSHEERAWVKYLKEVMYEAEDLSDEITTRAKMKELDEGDSFLNKVSRFFSCMNCILVSYNTSQEVKSIQLKLDAIAKDHARYNFKVGHQAIFEKEDDTCSFLNKTDENESIIGRENDVENVVDMLLDPNIKENIGFVVVVGIGGLGKTTLAQLVYHHNKVETMFKKKLWVCVSDQDGKRLNVKRILENIIESSTNKKPSDVSTMQSLQTKLQEELENKTYFLILDDVWTEDPNEWNKLRKYLTIGGRGSRVLVTTRSEKTAEVVLGRASHPKNYMLQSLSPDDSCRLFMLTALEKESDQANDPELIKLGKKIVKKCSYVPIAIKVVGSLLRGQTHRWESFEMNNLPESETTKNLMTSILKLSYDNLEPSVKNCFRSCAIFPKDFEMDKRNLISLWYALGLIGDSEDSFLILLKRCFFQYVEKNEIGVKSVKMHGLFHDFAHELIGDVIITCNPADISSGRNRQCFLDGRAFAEISFHERNIHTMNTTIQLDIMKTVLVNCRWLRSLFLYKLDLENLPESIGELLHLRYLDLSESKKLKTLPNSIAKLYNLQCLVMRDCHEFKEWPKDFCKLVNLRLLDIHGCRKLICMPLGIDQLINLRDLPNFWVGGESLIDELSAVAELKDLESLVNLRGEIWITILGNPASENENVREDCYLKHIKNLKMVIIQIPVLAHVTNQEALIAKLQPTQYLMELSLFGYKGTEIQRWGRAHHDWSIILPNLVSILLWDCMMLNGIPLLRNLKHLKYLTLSNLYNLEYMEISDSSESKDIPFFPSLEHLSILGLGRLKGWRVGLGDADSSSSSSSKSHWLPPFPRLSSLAICWCPELTSFPPCPTLKTLRVWHTNNLWEISTGEGHGIFDIKNCSFLQTLEINGCTRLTSVIGGLKHLTALVSLSLEDSYAEVDFYDIPWRSLPHNLRSLEFRNFDNLQILPIQMKHLTALQNLSISNCNSLKELPEWISCLSSLHSLTVNDCFNLTSLGTIQNITSLQKLLIENCDSLKGLPEWIGCLSSLHSLTINDCFNLTSLGTIQNISSLQRLDIIKCSRLTEACKEPSGKEWPKIQHIPHISITDWGE